MPTTTPARVPPSRPVLDQLPSRVVVFLRGVALHPEIRLAMKRVGYDAAAHAEGLALLGDVLALHGDVDPAPHDAAEATRDAIHALDAYLREHGPRLEAAVARAISPTEAALFARPPKDDVAMSVVRMAKLMSALDTRASTDPLIVLLAARGLDDAKRDELRALVATATRVAPIVPTHPSSERERELLALYDWHHEWTRAAKAAFKRADWRLWIGIGEAKRMAAANPAPNSD